MFLDKTIDNLYKTERRMGTIFKYFTGLIIFIACLGLFGLASITTVQRTKEIGIRKALGASTVKINLMLSKEFLKLVIFSNAISWPVAWYIMNKWLDGFAYKISINISIFILAGVIALAIAFSSVFIQAYKAANSNPAEVLRYQ